LATEALDNGTGTGECCTPTPNLDYPPVMAK
jgi:hypothetical protein